MGIIVGGPRAKWIHELGEFVVAGHYINDEPAMVIFPRNPNKGAVPCAICLSALYLYEDPRYLVQQAREFVRQMKMLDMQMTVMKVATIIDDHKLDLIKMPPDEKADLEKTVADLIVKVGGKTYEREIKEGDDKFSDFIK